MPKQTYLGDSVYVDLDNGMIKLTTNNGYPDDPRNIIYLEFPVWNNLVTWVSSLAIEKDEDDA